MNLSERRAGLAPALLIASGLGLILVGALVFDASFTAFLASKIKGFKTESGSDQVNFVFNTYRYNAWLFGLASLAAGLAALARPALLSELRPAQVFYAACGLAFAVFFIVPVFFMREAMWFPEYIPRLPGQPAGADLQATVDFSRIIFQEHASPYRSENCFYPPLALLAYWPLIGLEHKTAYFLVTAASLACLVFLVLAAPAALSGRGRRVQALVPLLFLGLASYGFQFQLERGQFDLITVSFALAAVLVFHRKPRLRPLAYLLLGIAVNLKVYPAIFALCLVVPEDGWLKNLKRMAALGLATAALLPVLGLQLMVDFFVKISSVMQEPYFWFGNLSLKSLAGLAEAIFKIPRLPVYLALAAFYLANLGLAAFLLLKRRIGPRDPFLLLACTTGALLIPEVSFDYKLPLLFLPAAAILLERSRFTAGGARRMELAALALFAFLFAATCFPFEHKFFFKYNTLVLLGLQAAGTALLLTRIFGKPGSGNPGN